MLSLSEKRERDNAHALALVDEILEKLTAVGAVRSATHGELVRPRVRGWVGQGIGIDRLDAAITAAKAARIAAGSQQPLNVGYIEAKLTATPGIEPVALLAPASTPASRTPPASVELAAYVSWARQRVELGAFTPAEAEQRIQAERERLGLAAVDAAA